MQEDKTGKWTLRPRQTSGLDPYQLQNNVRILARFSDGQKLVSSKSVFLTVVDTKKKILTYRAKSSECSQKTSSLSPIKLYLSTLQNFLNAVSFIDIFLGLK